MEHKWVALKTLKKGQSFVTRDGKFGTITDEVRPEDFGTYGSREVRVIENPLVLEKKVAALEAEVREATSLIHDLQQEGADLIEIGAAKERGFIISYLHSQLKRNEKEFEQGCLNSGDALVQLDGLISRFERRGRVLPTFWPDRLNEENKQLREAIKKIASHLDKASWPAMSEAAFAAVKLLESLD